LAANVALHRFLGTWNNQVDAFITLSEFQRDLMVKAGLPANRVFVKPNFYSGSPNVTPWIKRPGYVVFVGRLSEEKGVQTLLHAWANWGLAAPELRIIGNGPLREKLESIAVGLPVRFLGQQSAAETHKQIASASLLVLPSECFEGFGLVLGEAFAYGTPAAVSSIGALPSIVKDGENGLIFEPSDSHSLLNIVRSAWMSHGKLEKLSTGARRSFETLYTEDANYEMLMTIYAQAIEINKGKKK
jgi:glycosyltransferase involved in cell wall biosynthesis